LNLLSLAPLDSSKLAQTLPEYQDDTISIQEDDQEQEGGQAAQHTTKGSICESREEEEEDFGCKCNHDSSNEDDHDDESRSNKDDDISSFSEDTDLIVAPLKERSPKQPSSLGLATKTSSILFVSQLSFYPRLAIIHF
jgi:hypothetical protein